MHFSYLALPLILGVFIFVYLFFKYPRWAIAGLIIAKTLIDTTSTYYIYQNVNFLKIYGLLFAILGVIYIIKNRLKVFECPVTLLWLVFLGLHFISVFLIYDRIILEKAEYFIRILVGFSTLILFYNLFDFKKDKVFVFSVFVISGAICVMIWLIEVLFMIPRTSVAGVLDELSRIKGAYPTFFQFLYYGLQLIICALPLIDILNRNSLSANEIGKKNQTRNPYMTNFKNNSILIRILTLMLYLLIILSVMMVYKSYSKAGWIAVPLLLFLWFIMQKKYLPALLVIAGVTVFISVEPFKQEVGSLFRKELDVIVLKSNDWEPDTLFMGRYRRWKRGMKEFSGVPVINKLFGSPDIQSSPENDYLRILWHNGIIGLSVYLMLILQSGFLVLRRYLRDKDPASLSGLLVLVFYLIFAMGFYPLLIPAFNWLVWGVIGFLLSDISRKE